MRCLIQDSSQREHGAADVADLASVCKSDAIVLMHRVSVEYTRLGSRLGTVKIDQASLSKKEASAFKVTSMQWNCAPIKLF